MKAITRRNVFHIIFAILIFCICLGFLVFSNTNAYAETEIYPFTIIGETSGKEYYSGDYINEHVTITLVDSRYSKIHFKFPNANSFTYTKNKTLTTGLINGEYRFYLSAEDNEQSQEFYVYFDNKSPVTKIYSNNIEVVDSVYAYDNLTCSALDDGSGVKKIFYKTPSAENYTEYLPDTEINSSSECGWYSFYAADNCQNTSEIKSVFFKPNKDTVAGKWISRGENLQNDGYTNQPLTFEFDMTEYTARVSLNENECVDYISGQELSEDGDYCILLTNLEQQEDIFTAHIDTVPPVGQLYANYLPINSGRHTNEKIYFSWDENLVATINDMPYSKNEVVTQEGDYTFLLVDKAGNQVIYTVTIDVTSPTYNFDKLNAIERNISRWYIVSINEKDYSFSTYSEAIAFACEKEFEKEVTVLHLDDIGSFNQQHLVAGNTKIHVGEYWLYKSKTNPDILLYYFDQTLLNEAISYYAKDFVSNKNYLEYDCKNNYGISSESMSDNLYYFDDGSFVPFINDFIFDCVDSVKLFAEIADGSGTKFQLEYGLPFNAQITVGGLYKITETDAAENETVYYCYFDIFTPEIKVKAKIYGDVAPTELSVTQDSLQSVAAYYYESFNICDLIDADKWTVLLVEHNDNKQFYVKREILPTLSRGGEYNLTVYDRFNNIYSFTVYIVGNSANIMYKNNTDDSSFNLFITLEQSFDTIVSLEIYRNGKIIGGVTTDKLSYEFCDNGLYTVKLQDNFGRVVTSEYSFNVVTEDTVAPTITLRGVENEGITDTSVVIENISEDAKIEVYKNGMLIEYTLGNELTEYGEYVVILTDLSGNISTYCFTIQHTLNAGSIILIVLSILVLASALLAIILMRKIGIFSNFKRKKSASKTTKKG